MTTKHSKRGTTKQSFLQLTAFNQDVCTRTSHFNLNKLEPSVQQTITNVDALLEMLDKFASCFWGCHRGNHTIEYLVGRSVSYSVAIVRLLNMGHYDEALALTRSICEIGNLVWLFLISPEELEVWILSSDTDRKTKFSPVSVRKKIEQINNITPHNKIVYSRMSEIGVHPNPKNPPNASHNLHSIPTLGGTYQEIGFIRSWTELGWAVASVGGPAVRIAQVSETVESRIVDLACSTVEQLPSLEQITESTGSSENILSMTERFDRTIRRPDSPDRNKTH